MPSTATAATTRRPSAPPTRAERRTVLLFLATLAARPIDGDDLDALGKRPPVYLHRALVADEWANVASVLDVRRSLGRRTGSRTLGRTGFVAALKALSDDARALHDRDRAHEHEEAERAKADLHAAHERAVQALYTDAEEQRRTLNYSDVATLAEDRDAQVADLFTDLPTLLRPGQRDDTVALAHRRTGLDTIRLRRDTDADAFEAWERLADSLAAPEDEPAEWDALLAEAEAIGFDTTSALPASAVFRVLSWDDEDDEDDEPATPVARLPLRPAFAPPVHADDLADVEDAEPAPARPSAEARARSRFLKAAYLAEHGNGSRCPECGRLVCAYPTEADCTSNCLWT